MTLDITCTLLAATTNYAGTADNEQAYGHFRESSAPFWWMFFHIEMLILAPTSKESRNGEATAAIIERRMR